MTTRPDEWYLLCQQHSEQLDTLGREYAKTNKNLDKVEEKLNTLLERQTEIFEIVQTYKELTIILKYAHTLAKFLSWFAVIGTAVSGAFLAGWSIFKK